MKISSTAIFLSLALFAVVPVHSVKPASSSEINNAEAFDSHKAWQEFEDQFRLFYAYLDRLDIDVDAQLARSKALALQTQNRAAFRKILHQTALTFSDPHFIIGPFDKDDYSIIPTGSDIATSYTGTKYYVVDVRSGSAADAAGIRPGWEIISADGIPIKRASVKVYGETLNRPTAKQYNYGAMLAVSGLRNMPRKLVFRDGGKMRIVDLPPTYEFSETLKSRPLLDTSQKGDVGVIRINNSLGNNELIREFDDAVKTLSNSEAIIIDLRNTPSGGNTEVARSIIGHFVGETKSYQVHEIPSYEREFTVPRRFVEQVKPRVPHYPQRVVVLGGRWTGSMGEGLVIGLDAAADAYTIASDMGDLLGGLSNIDLQASGARMDLGTEALFHVNGTPREKYVADLPLESSDRDGDGRDPALIKALSYLKRQAP